MSIAFADFADGLVDFREGEIERAASRLGHGYALCQASDLPVIWIQVAATLGSAYVSQARLTEGADLLDRAAARGAAIGFRYLHAQILAWLGEARVRAGRTEEAAGLAARALSIAREQRERGHEAWGLRLLGLIALASDDPAGAPPCQSVALAAAPGSVSEHAPRSGAVGRSANLLSSRPGPASVTPLRVAARVD